VALPSLVRIQPLPFSRFPPDRAGSTLVNRMKFAAGCATRTIVTIVTILLVIGPGPTVLVGSAGRQGPALV